MGFFQDLGLDELIAGINEFKDEMTGLKDDLLGGVRDEIINPITEQAGDVKGTIEGIASDISDDSK